MKVLLISNTLDIYYQTKKLVGNQNELKMLSFETFKNVETVADEVYEQKLNEMCKWKWYYDWEEMKK